MGGHTHIHTYIHTHRTTTVTLAAHARRGLITQFTSIQRSDGIIESINSIIESVDSISRDERDVPLTQYITNA